MYVIKRDGQKAQFDSSKIFNAICKAMLETEKGVDTNVATHVTNSIAQSIKHREEVHIEEIQDLVEQGLMSRRPDVAKKYILYRNKRAEMRVKGWDMSDLQYDIWNHKYRFNGESFDEWVHRVSGGNPRIARRIRKKQFLFGGRILAGRGLPEHGIRVTYSNCYVLSPPHDSIEGIWNTARDMARTYSFGGGVGISLRNIRPRKARVHNAARTTSGAVSFMDLYSLTTGLIGQEGRRGALMISIPSSHPDLEEFIDVKRDLSRVTKANISVEWSDDFMRAVQNRKTYTLRFEVKDTGEVIEKEVDAYKLFRRAAENNWLMAEPGCLFWDRISSYHLMSADPEFYFAGTNPCAEEPLPPGGSCLLGSHNLSEFVIAPFTKHAKFDFDSFIEATHDAVEALNEVLDEGLPLHPLQEQRDSVGDLRQIGLGVMGIHEMLIKLGIVYGSPESLELCEQIAKVMLVEAVRKSALIAKEKGTFGRYKWENISQSKFFKTLIPDDVKQLVKKYGLRNSQLLCIAPTGSISTMLGVSGGIEPIFALSFNRTTETLHEKATTYKVYTPIVKQYMDIFGIKDEDDLPDLFVTAHKLNWKNRIEMQAVWQKYIDASISSTINLPEETSVEEVVDLYLYAWKMGLKGCTIYRDNCARTGILTLDKEDEEPTVEQEPEEKPTEQSEVKGYFSSCPECGTKTVYANGCVTCPSCGFSPCS
jgi:ribonucleoside-diphosphate reductase alpha chain